MWVGLEGRFLFCALALSCIAHDVNSLPARSKTEDAKSADEVLKPEADVIKLEESRQMEAPVEEITNELEKLLVSMKKREATEKEFLRESQPGPTNVVLIMSREPLTFSRNGTEQKRSTYALFPVKHYVQDKVKRSIDEPLLMVSPVLLPRKGPYRSTHSCQAALDNSVAALLEGARVKRQMVTGFLASENLSFNDPLTNLWQKRTVGEVSNAEPVSSVEPGEHSVVKRSVEKDDDAEKKMEEGSSLIAPINDKFQKIGIEDKGSGILYKKVEIVGGSKKSEEVPVKEGADPVKGKVVKRETEEESVKDEAESEKRDESEKKREESEKKREESEKEGVESDKRSPSLKTTGNVDKADEKVVTDRAGEAAPWDLFDAINRMRRSFLDHFLRGIGFDFGQNQGNRESAFGSPLVGLVDNTITDLQKDAGPPGFMLVVSGGDANETAEVVKLVRRKTNPVDTLVVVTGMCPEPDPTDMNTNFWQFDSSNQMIFSTQEQRLIPNRQREANRIPVYASGPGSEVLNEVDTLWNIPVAIKNITVEAPLTKINSAASKENDRFYGYKSDDGKAPSVNPFEFYTINNGGAPTERMAHSKDNSQSSEEAAASPSETFPTKHRETRRSANWGRLSAQHVREKMAAAAVDMENMYGGDEAEAPVPPSWFDDDYNNDVRHDEMLALAQSKKAREGKGKSKAEEVKAEGEKHESVGAVGRGESAGACVLVTCAMFATIRLF